MKDAWEGPVLRNNFIVFLIVTLFIVIPPALYFRPSRRELIIIAMFYCALYISLLVPMMLDRRVFIELWNSDRRYFEVDLQEARPLLEGALASSGLFFKEVPVTDPKQRLRFEVGRDIGVEMLQGKDVRRVVIFIWPVDVRSRRDVDGLKRSIDAAFEQAK